MHQAAYEWVAKNAHPCRRVLDIGGRDINGTPRALFPFVDEYLVIDLHDGVNVDIVADVTTWTTDEQFDMVLCCEVLEHVRNWRDVIAAAFGLTAPGGTFIVTCAGPGRAPHSAGDGGPLADGEFYENVEPNDLWLALSRWREIVMDQLGTDLRAVATR